MPHTWTRGGASVAPERTPTAVTLGVPAARIRPSRSSLGHDRKSLEAQFCVPPRRFSGTAQETSCGSDTLVCCNFGRRMLEKSWRKHTFYDRHLSLIIHTCDLEFPVVILYFDSPAPH
ncbi:hypothetical protein H8959_008366 [Pygathrix nigripes]